mgnify:CR=1 FL=1
MRLRARHCTAAGLGLPRGFLAGPARCCRPRPSTAPGWPLPPGRVLWVLPPIPFPAVGVSRLERCISLPFPSRVASGARFRLPLQRPGRAARTTGVLSWMALFLLGKTDRPGGGVSLRGRERERIELHLGVNEEPAERLCVRLKRQVKVGDLSGGVGHRPG